MNIISPLCHDLLMAQPATRSTQRPFATRSTKSQTEDGLAIPKSVTYEVVPSAMVHAFSKWRSQGMTGGRIVIDLGRTVMAQTKSDTADGLVIYKRVTHQIQTSGSSHAFRPCFETESLGKTMAVGDQIYQMHRRDTQRLWRRRRFPSGGTCN
ncbi:hypothetical protein BGW80DRAFT_293631 [Lactifluus volemus]|nr:hypothetical protein BGW80DRAFT_293631 [Lactifluus volemus]